MSDLFESLTNNMPWRFYAWIVALISPGFAFFCARADNWNATWVFTAFAVIAAISLLVGHRRN
ncbi:MAG: hypothetical protein OQJ97_09525 [Rhodospirillales bacterium]|nr:hypothetical protein [Rhodospirillales bacterium]